MRKLRGRNYEAIEQLVNVPLHVLAYTTEEYYSLNKWVVDPMKNVCMRNKVAATRLSSINFKEYKAFDISVIPSWTAIA